MNVTIVLDKEDALHTAALLLAGHPLGTHACPRCGRFAVALEKALTDRQAEEASMKQGEGR